MDEQERLRVDNTNTGDSEVNVQAGRTRDITVQNARASGNGGVFQAGRDQYNETHLYFGVGVHRTRRVEADAGVEVDPYPRGMAALRPEDAEWFFGRDDLLEDLVERVDERFREGGGPLMVMAPSGAGKSSLLHAGLIPKLEQGAIPGSQHWPGLRITPTARPIAALAEAITVLTGEPVADVERELVERPDRRVEALGEVVRERSSTVIAANARLMVIVDQLEELFTLCGDDDERRRFLDVLSRLCAPSADGEPVALVVFGMRADFYAHCAEYPELRDSVRHGHVVVGPMRTKELREAILYPAQRAGLRVEAGLVELLLVDLGALDTKDGKDVRPRRYEAGRLPLLAHALRATYLRRHGRTLSVEAYRKTEGIEKAVAKTADDTFKELDPAAREAAPGLFLRLIKIGDGTEHTRRRVPRTELLGANTDQATTAALDAFTSKRLLTQGLDHDTVEITHEALIHAWPRLRKWIDDDRAGNLIRQQVTEAATAWENEGHDRAALYRGARLATAREHTSTPPHNGTLTPTTQHFLRASTRHENRATRRRNTVIAVLSLLTVLSLIAAYVANTQRNVATANQLTAQADQVLQDETNGADLSLASQLNLAAYLLNKNDKTIKSKLYDTANDPLSAPPIPQERPVDSMAFSPDGQTFAGGSIGDSEDGWVQVWDVSVPGKMEPLGEPLVAPGEFVNSVVFSPDGQTLVGGGSRNGGDGWVQVWDVSVPGKMEPLGEPLVAPGESVDSVVFSPDGQTLVGGSGKIGDGGDARVQVWDVSVPGKMEPLGEPLAAPGESVDSVVFSPDGQTLVGGSNSGGGDAWVQVWDVSVPGKVEPLGEPLAAPDGPVNSMAFSPDGKTLVGGGGDGWVQVWDVSVPGKAEPLGEPVAVLGDGSVRSVVFSPDGQTLVGSGSGGSGDGGDARVQVWDVSVPGKAEPLGEPVAVPGEESVTSVVFSPDGQTFVSGSRASGGRSEGGLLRLWDVPDHPLVTDGSADSVAFSPDGQTFAGGSGGDGDGGDGWVQVWDMSVPGKAEPLGEPLSVPGESVDSVAFSPDSQTLVGGGGDGWVQVWDVSVPGKVEPLGEPLSVPGESVDSVAFSPDGQTFAGGSGGDGDGGDGWVQVWDMSVPGKAEPLGEPLSVPGESVYSVAFSPDGQTLASASGNIGDGGDGWVQVWDMSVPGKAEPLGEPLSVPGEPVLSVAFSPDGETLASGSNGSSGSIGDGENGWVRLWDVSVPGKAEPLGEPLSVPGEQVVSVAFSPDGQSLASGSNGRGGDGLVRLWDVSVPGKADPSPLVFQGERVQAVAFSSDGQTLASVRRSTVRLRNVDIKKTIDRICNATGDYLTPSLYGRYFPGGESIESPCLDWRGLH